MSRFRIALCLICQVLLTTAAFAANPLTTTSDAPYGAPRFDRIRAADFTPAIEQGIREYEAEIAAIKSVDPAGATFENVILTLSRSGQTLYRTRMLLAHLRSNLGTDSIVDIAQRMEPAISRAFNGPQIDSVLFNLIRTLYDRRNDMSLDSLQLRTLERYYRNAAENGALCTPEQQQRLLKINADLADKSIRFEQNVKKAGERFVFFIADTNSLPGPYQALRKRLADRAAKLGRPGEWAVGSAEYGPVVGNTVNGNVREQLWKAYWSRCDVGSSYDNATLAAEILNLRLEKARILGYETYADYALRGSAAGTPQRVRDLLEPLLRAAVAKARSETAELEAFAAKTMGPGFRAEEWDIPYFSYWLRMDKFGFSSNQMRNFLAFDDVLKGVFHVSRQLYGITFDRRTDIPSYHPDVLVFEALDHNGSPLGLLYLDPFARRGKRAGGWSGSLRRYTLTEQGEELPAVTICCNFTPPPSGQPALLTPRRVTTLFHEFGHALARLLARGPYPAVTGNFPTDMAELPSQLMEHWAFEPSVLKAYARNSANGRPISDKLIEKYLAEELYMKASTLCSSYTQALYDLAMHSITAPVTAEEIEALGQKLRTQYDIPAFISVAPASLFSHVFCGPYPSRYYAYAWASVLDTDAFAAFTQTGDLFDRATADRFRRHILTQIGYDAPMKQYLRFRGAEPDPAALLHRYGLQSPE